MKKWLFPIYSLLVFLCIATLASKVARKHSVRLLDYDLSSRAAQRPIFFQKASPHIFSQIPGSETAIFTYREDISRTGVSSGVLPRFPIKKIGESPQVNFGIHTASKSSPAVDSTGVYIGGDTGWFYALTPELKVRWKFYSGESDRGIHGTALLTENYVIFGAYQGVLYCLEKSTGNLMWSVRLADAIGSSQVLIGNYLYVSAETGKQLRGALFKIRLTDGHVEWQSPWFAEQVHSSPVVIESLKTAYVGANNGHLYAIDSENGRIRWFANLHGAIKGTPAFDGNHLLVSSWAEFLWALDPMDGRIVWKTPLGGLSQSSVTVFSKENMAVVNARNQGVLGISLLDGKRLWQIPNAKANGQVSALGLRDSIGNGLFVTGCENRILCVGRVRDGKIQQTLPLSGILSSVPTIFEGRLYLSLNDGPVEVYQ